MKITFVTVLVVLFPFNGCAIDVNESKSNKELDEIIDGLLDEFNLLETDLIGKTLADNEDSCGCESCTQNVLDMFAGEFTCGSRMAYLRNKGNSDRQACIQIADNEFPAECGACNPIQCNPDDEEDYSCGCVSCTQNILDTSAGEFTCGNRMAYLRDKGYSDREACTQISDNEFPAECGACNPIQCNRNPESSPVAATTSPPVPPSNSPPSGEVEIKIMSYNTQFSGYFDGRIPSFGAKIREVGADVVGVQECQIPELLRDESGYAFVTGTWNQNYIFYNPERLTVIDSGWSTIPKDNNSDRTFTWAIFEIIGNGYQFIFFNTHLPHRQGQASDPNTHSLIGQALLTKRNEILADNSMPTVVVCDCNTFASDGASQGRFEDILGAADIPRLYVARGNPGFGGLDKIFASSNDWTGSDGSDVGTGHSDHTAIAINLTSK